MSLRRLKEAAEKAKCELSSITETEISLPFITADAFGPKHLKTRITRSTFEQLASDLIGRCRQICSDCDRDACLGAGALAQVVLVGGSSRVPAFQSMVKEFFGKEPNRSVHPEQVVAVGAAYYANMLRGQYKERELLLLDVIPRSLSVALKDDTPSVLIRRNTTIPTTGKATFTTTSDNQDAVTVRVYEGDEAKASGNTFVGQITLTGLPPAPAGVPVIEVTFDIDATGTFSVFAADSGTGKSVHAEMTAPYRLNPAQMKVLSRKVEAALEGMRRRMEEERKRELDEQARRSATSLTTKLGQFLDKHGDLLPPQQMSMLVSGRELIEDYLERQVSRDHVGTLLDSVQQEYHNAIIAAAMNLAVSVAISDRFCVWASAASGRIESPAAVEALVSRLRQSVGDDIQTLISLFQVEEDRVRAELVGRFFRNLVDLPDALAMSAVAFSHLSPFEVRLDPDCAAQLAKQKLGWFFVLGELRPTNSSDARRWAAQQIARAGQDRDYLLLLRYLEREKDRTVSSVLEEFLLAAPHGVWLGHYLEAPNDQRKWLLGLPTAAKALQRDAARALANHDSDPAVRLRATEALCDTGIEGHAPDLARLLAAEEDEGVRSALSRLLGSYGDQEAVIPLLAGIAHSSPATQQVVLAVLRQLRPVMTKELGTLLDVAERVYIQRRRPTLGQRLRLRQISKKHEGLRSIVQSIRQEWRR
jgi:hypothetical protein